MISPAGSNSVTLSVRSDFFSDPENTLGLVNPRTSRGSPPFPVRELDEGAGDWPVMAANHPETALAADEDGDDVDDGPPNDDDDGPWSSCRSVSTSIQGAVKLVDGRPGDDPAEYMDDWPPSRRINRVLTCECRSLGGELEGWDDEWDDELEVE